MKVTALPLLLICASGQTLASSELEQRLERCALLGDANARLACYDGLTKGQCCRSAAKWRPCRPIRPSRPPARSPCTATQAGPAGRHTAGRQHFAHGAMVGTR
jgi:hypothetical protein